MENKFNQKLQQWLLTPDKEKDYAEGAKLLLQLTNKKIMYRNISVNPKGKAEFINGKLQRVSQGVDMDFAMVANDIDNGLLLLGEFGENLELAGRCCRRFPAHGCQQVVGTSDEGSLVCRDEFVAAS